jgi:hypothetical protein
MKFDFVGTDLVRLLRGVPSFALTEVMEQLFT